MSTDATETAVDLHKLLNDARVDIDSAPSSQFAQNNLAWARRIRDAGHHEAATPFFIEAAKSLKSLDILQEARWNLDEPKTLAVFKVGLSWPYNPVTEWSTWRFYDELSILAYWQKDQRTSYKAYKILCEEANYPQAHKERIEFNGQFCLPENNDTYESLCKEMKDIAASLPQKMKTFNNLPSILHIIYLGGGYEFGLHHYLALKTAHVNMVWKRIHIYNDNAPTNNRWWTLATQIPGVHVFPITVPTRMNYHAVTFKQHQADIIRLVAMNEMGGVYHDLDMLTLKSYKHLLEELDSTRYVCLVLEHEEQRKLSNAIIMSMPQNRFIQTWIEAYETLYGDVKDHWGGLSVCKPYELAQSMKDNIIILPTETFLPFDYFHTEYFTKSTSRINFNNTYGVHLWDTEQQKRGILPKDEALFATNNSVFYQQFGKYLPTFKAETTSEGLIPKKHKLLLSVEGNIGSGKSTLLEDLKNAHFFCPHVVIQEDVKGWTSFVDSQGHNILQKYYEDPESYSYCFQSLVLTSRIYKIIEAINSVENGIVIMERSHLTDLFIFAKNLYENKAMNEIEWLTYNTCHNLVNQMLNLDIDAFLYLRAKPEVCASRITGRNRKGEESIKLELIESLHKKHDDWLLKKEDNIIVIDGDQERTPETREQLLLTVVDYVENLISKQ